MKKKLIITGKTLLPKELGEDFSICHIPNPQGYGEIIEALADAWGYVLGGPEYLSADVLSKAPHLRCVVVMGTGIPSFIDETAAASLGISVFNTPNLNADAVAEFGVGTIIMCLANAFASVDGVKTGTFWWQQARLSLANAKILVVGAGQIATSLITKLQALGARQLQYYARRRNETFEGKCGVSFVGLAEGLAWADLASVQVSYNQDSHHLINHDILAMANTSLKLLNFCNPLVVEPVALRAWLHENREAFAFIDGYYNEWIANKGPTDDQHGLLNLLPQKFVATSHIAAQEGDAVRQILELALTKIRSQL